MSDLDEWLERQARAIEARERAEAAVAKADEVLQRGAQAAAAREASGATDWVLPEPPKPKEATQPRHRAPQRDWAAEGTWVRGIAAQLIRDERAVLVDAVAEALGAHTAEATAELEAKLRADFKTELASAVRKLRKEMKSAQRAPTPELSSAPAVRRVV